MCILYPWPASLAPFSDTCVHARATPAAAESVSASPGQKFPQGEWCHCAAKVRAAVAAVVAAAGAAVKATAAVVVAAAAAGALLTVVATVVAVAEAVAEIEIVAAAAAVVVVVVGAVVTEVAEACLQKRHWTENYY